MIVDPLITVSNNTYSLIDLKLNPSVSILVIADTIGSLSTIELSFFTASNVKEASSYFVTILESSR
ncbi:MAG: hypothetical protein SGJ00_08560 [bacterium]|nr:hypothetical protein [bacterium]